MHISYLHSQTHFYIGIWVIEKVIIQGEIDKKDLIQLEFLTHKISTIASLDVLKEYSNFINVIKTTSRDKQITSLESEELSLSLAKLCGMIRYDLIASDSKSQIEIQKLIENNIDKI